MWLVVVDGNIMTASRAGLVSKPLFWTIQVHWSRKIITLGCLLVSLQVDGSRHQLLPQFTPVLSPPTLFLLLVGGPLLPILRTWKWEFHCGFIRPRSNKFTAYPCRSCVHDLQSFSLSHTTRTFQAILSKGKATSRYILSSLK